MRFSPMHQTMVLTLQLARFSLAIGQVHTDGHSYIQTLVGLLVKPKRL